MASFYVTTAIPYVNADPHVGFALEAVLADALARYHRLRGDDVRFLTGTDDNSIKSVHAAERLGVPVADLVAGYASRFRALREVLDLSFDDFIRTSSDPRHLRGVERLWRAIEASGDVYKDHYRGRFCVGCEWFLDDEECAEHPGAVEDVEEENWFFRLSRYQDQLRDLVESDRLRVVPASRRNEVLALIRSGLRDFSISRTVERSRGWGVPVPGDESQVMFVWFDALGNYVTALEGPLYERYWVDNANTVHVIGKDIVRQHAVYWPAMLLSAGQPLPSTILTHGFVTSDGRKMSKSLGNVVDPFVLVDEFGTDAVRYFLLRHIRTTDDGDFTRERFVRAYDADLAHQLGNLVARVLAMVRRYVDGVVPPLPVPAADDDRELVAVGEGLSGAVDDAVGRFAIHEALAAVWRVIETANRYVVRVEPWALARGRDAGETGADERLGAVLAHLAEAIRVVAYHLRPFLPSTASRIERWLGREAAPADGRWADVLAGARVASGEPLFPKQLRRP